MFGKIEIGESYFGAKRVHGYRGKLKSGRGALKQSVFGILKLTDAFTPEIIPNCKKPMLQAIIEGKIDKSAIIYSDGWRGYDGLVNVGFNKHYRVNHSNNEFSKEHKID